MTDRLSQQIVLARQRARAGAPAEARQILRQVVASRRDDVDAWMLLGQVCGALNLHREAEQAFAAAARLAPQRADAHVNLGIACRQQSRPEDALAAFGAALAVAPRLVMALANVVGLLHELERQREALPYLETWLAADPAGVDAHYTAAVIHQALDELPSARAHYERVLALGVDGFYAYSTHLNLGVVCLGQRDLEAAIAHFRQALAIRPDCAVSHCNLGNALKEQGDFTAAIASFERALELDPDFADAHSNILFCLNTAPGHDAQEVFARHAEWGRRHATAGDTPPHDNDRDPSRRLRIGYVSADFREHAVGFFLAGVLREHDPERFEITCYANSAQEDAMTRRLRADVPGWRRIEALDDAAVAAMIRADGIDILVDLSGHTAGNRLRMFARRPAPVQVTWLGYCNTTGVASIDYLLADAGVVPEDGRQRFSEQVVRLPGSYLCYQAPPDAPALAPPPCLSRGHVTFGCFNNLSKVNEAMLALWAEILRRTPDARLLLKARQLADAGVQQRTREFFATRGVAPDRLTLNGAHLDHAALLATYGEIDIALDTHPYSGVTTTCEALWMGVPVVTLTGDRFISRNTAAILANVGLADLVASSAEGYVDTAAALAADRDRLVALRPTRRDAFRASPLGDARRFTQNLEAAYRRMWKNWCAAAG